jgi:REP element-mobilizing transposase RayT
MASTFANLIYHIVFSTKNRVPSITPNLKDGLYDYLGGIVRSEGGILLEIGGVADHVHLLAKLKPVLAVADALRTIKANSSRWVNDEKNPRERFEWQVGYAALSVSESQVAAVRRYIQRQEEHHKKVSFRDELVALLEKNGIPYDERYLLG